MKIQIKEWKPSSKFKPVSKNQRAKLIHEVMVLVWDSLNSHLAETYAKKADGGKKFQKKCVQEYTIILNKISRLY